MPGQLKSFEEVATDLMAQNPGMSYVDATAHIRSKVSAGDPNYVAIPDVNAKLTHAYMSSLFHSGVKGFAETIGPAMRAGGGLASMLGAKGGEEVANRFSPQNIDRFGAEAEASPWAEFGGQALGIGAFEGAAGPAGALIPGTSRAAQATKGALSMLGLQKVGALGNMSTGNAVALGAGIPLALGPLAWLGKKAGILADESAAAAKEIEDRQIPNTEATTPEEAAASRPWWKREPAAPASRASGTPISERAAVGGLQGQYGIDRYSEAAAGGAPEAPMTAPRNPAIEPRPTNMRPGQPYESQFMSRNPSASKVAGADIYHVQGHPIYGSGPPYPASWDKPFVIDTPVSGPEGWKYAAESLFQGNPAVIDRLQTAQDPEGLAQTLVANEVKKRGYDAVSLHAPGLSGETLDLRDFSGKAKHPEMTPDLFRFQKAAAKAVEKPVAKPADVGAEVFGKTKGKKAPKDVPFEQARVHAMGDETLANQADVAHASVIERASGQSAGDLNAEDVARGNDRLTGHTTSFSPEIQQALRTAQKRGRSWIVRWLAPQYMSDHPVYQGMIQDTMTQVAQSNRQAATWEKAFREVKKRVPGFEDPKKFDEIARAVDGLSYEPEDGYKNYAQTALNVPKWADDAAREFARFRDEGYSFLTGNDPRVPYVLEARGLAHNRRQLERLRLLQTEEGTKQLESDGKRNLPTETEYFAANELRNIPSSLGFNETHDLDFEPITGWMKFHPHANEKGMLQDAIGHLQNVKQAAQEGNHELGKYTFADEEKLQAMLKRNKELEDRETSRLMSRMPNRDYVPRRKWMSILHGQEHPYFYSTDPDEIMSQWVTGITQKRIADVNLARTKFLLRDASIDGPTKDYAVEYANAVRGAKGYSGDARFALGMENALHAMGFKDAKISPSEVHKWTGTLQELNFFGKMSLSPMRFPIINLTHLFPTAGAIAKPSTFARGIMNTLFDLGGSLARAKEAGVISEDLEMFKEIGMNKEGRIAKIGKPLRALTYVTENFRKSAAYQIGLESARRGEFSPTVRGFVNDIAKYGGNRQTMNEAYARAFTFTTQFEFGKTGKAVAMQGGPMIRAATQFRSWESNMIGLYKEMLQQRDYAGFARGMAALAFLGGPSVAVPLGLYDSLRHGLLKHGYNLPDKPFYHYGLKLAGLDGSAIDQIDIRSLADPFGFSHPFTMTGIGGPTFGALAELGTNVGKDLDKGQTYKIPRELMNAFAPQAQDIIDAAQEYAQGGVLGPGGMIDKNRSWLSIMVRGLDLQPSIASQRAKFEDDIEAAMVSGNNELVDSLVNEMQSRNLMMTPDMARRMRAYRRGYERAQQQPWDF